jgi:peptide/nickel transport system permease protein
VTLTLIAGGVLAAGLLGVALGVVSARSTGVLARVVDVASLVGSAIPPFWLGLVLSAVFAVGLRLVPVVGYTSPAVDPVAWFLSILLPVATLALAGTAIVAKQTRDAMRDELGKDYVLVLRSHGATEWTVQIKHALRNAGVPVVTVLGVLLIGLLGGTVLVESVFSLPGLGGLAVTSTLRHDLPVIQGVTVLFAVVVVAVNLLVDLVNAWINPKVSA